MTGMYLQVKSEAFMVTGLLILASFASAIGEFSVLGDVRERQYTEQLKQECLSRDFSRRWDILYYFTSYPQIMSIFIYKSNSYFEGIISLDSS